MADDFGNRHGRLMRQLQDVRNELTDDVINKYWERIPADEDEERDLKNDVARGLQRIKNEIANLADDLLR